MLGKISTLKHCYTTFQKLLAQDKKTYFLGNIVLTDGKDIDVPEVLTVNKDCDDNYLISGYKRLFFR